MPWCCMTLPQTGTTHTKDQGKRNVGYRSRAHSISDQAGFVCDMKKDASMGKGKLIAFGWYGGKYSHLD